MQRKLLTLVHIHTGNMLLLGLKKRGFGEGRWNGFGGKVHAGETIEDAARRELREEAGIEASDLKKRAVLEFTMEDTQELLIVHMFSARRYRNEPRETEEMLPRWFDEQSLPYSQMWADDPYWMPYFLAGKNFRGSFRFRDPDTLLEAAVAEVGEDAPI